MSVYSIQLSACILADVLLLYITTAELRDSMNILECQGSITTGYCEDYHADVAMHKISFKIPFGSKNQIGRKLYLIAIGSITSGPTAFLIAIPDGHSIVQHILATPFITLAMNASYTKFIGTVAIGLGT